MNGRPPVYGTGWMPVAGKPNLPPNYYSQDHPAPPYTAPQSGNMFNGNNHANNGFYGGQQTGIELQQPNHTYQPHASAAEAAPDYSPPDGPPPARAGKN